MTRTMPHSWALADLPVAVPTGLDKATKVAMSGGFAVIASVLLVFFGIVVWLVFFRKPARSRQRNMLVDGSGSERSSHRRRRRREAHRTMNPTLAQTGGLPPKGAGGSTSIDGSKASSPSL